VSNIVKISFIIGGVLTLVGSFLPWQREGDLISYWTYGIRIFPSIKDNGGLVVVLLCLIVIMLIFQPPKLIEKPLSWGVVLSFVLVLDSFLHIVKWVFNRANAGGVIGAPMIQIGLVMIFIGSILLLFSTVIYYLKS
jgi:hypothetical protein